MEMKNHECLITDFGEERAKIWSNNFSRLSSTSVQYSLVNYHF